MTAYDNKKGDMAKLILTLDDNLINSITVDKPRMTLGRRPYNDILVDNIAVSGEHAILQSIGAEYYVEDLNSTNGTFINGKKIKRQILQTGDQIEIGKFIIKYINDVDVRKVQKNSSESESESVTALDSDEPIADNVDSFEKTRFAETYVAVKIVSGASMGKEIPLVKIVTTIGKPGEAVIAITKRTKGYVVAHVEGAVRPTLNSKPFGIDAVPLRNGDLFELAGVVMEFIETA